MHQHSWEENAKSGSIICNIYHQTNLGIMQAYKYKSLNKNDQKKHNKDKHTEGKRREDNPNNVPFNQSRYKTTQWMLSCCVIAQMEKREQRKSTRPWLKELDSMVSEQHLVFSTHMLWNFLKRLKFLSSATCILFLRLICWLQRYPAIYPCFFFFTMTN